MLFFVPDDLDLWPWPSNSSERGTKHVFRVNLAQIRSAVPDIFHTQTKKPQHQKQNHTQFIACGNKFDINYTNWTTESNFPSTKHVVQNIVQTGHKVGEKIPEFSRLFQSHNYTFPEVVTTKILAIWQQLRRFLAIFSLYMRRSGYFSWHCVSVSE